MYFTNKLHLKSRFLQTPNMCNLSLSLTKKKACLNHLNRTKETFVLSFFLCKTICVIFTDYFIRKEMNNTLCTITPPMVLFVYSMLSANG